MPDRTAAVFLAADERFGRALAVTVRSVVAHLTPGRAVELHLCDMGLRPDTRGVIESVAQHPDIRLRWISDLREKVANLPQSWPHISVATYARLFIPALLPDSVDKALYLDCDLILRRCVGDLFDTPLDGYGGRAVADAITPYVSTPYGLPYWHRLGRQPGEVNFNAGVLLMNLAVWRELDVTGATLNYLAKEHLFQGDQAAINAVLGARMGELDPRWNQQAGHFVQALEAALPYTDEQVRQLKADPWIVHYSTHLKPWTDQSSHPFWGEWFARLDETPYRGWRPRRSTHYVRLAQRAAREARQRLRPGVGGAPTG